MDLRIPALVALRIGACGLVIVFALCPPASGATLTGRCVAVFDGDSIVVQTQGRERREVRLQGIDAPERGQRYGARARTHLASLVYRKRVTIEWHKRDAYDRLVGEVVAEGIDVNLAQVQSGFAWVYREYLDELPRARRAILIEAEIAARRDRLGVWRDRDPTPPWQWRHRHSRAPHRSTSSHTSRADLIG